MKESGGNCRGNPGHAAQPEIWRRAGSKTLASLRREALATGHARAMDSLRCHSHERARLVARPDEGLGRRVIRG